MSSRSQQEVSLGHRPNGRWRFDAEVTRVFDDMLQRSIPDYGAMRRAVFEVGRRCVRAGTTVVDLGSSRGEALAPFVDEFGSRLRYVGVEVSPTMLDACRARFADELDSGIVRLLPLDLRDGYPDVEASLTLAVLTLQFTPVEHRARILRDAFDRTVEGGALIVVEKVIASSDGVGRVLSDAYASVKQTNGYGREEIERKRLSLEGVLVPLTAAWNEELLRRAGFRDVECIWRSLNFAGWLALK